jgi:cysteine desulfurase
MIYADANGSHPLLPEVQKYLLERLQSPLWGNPNAIHSLGQKILSALEKSRYVTAQALGAQPSQLVWTSGSNEGITTAIHHFLLPQLPNPKTIYCSSIEHAAVIETCRYYQKHHGFQLVLIPALETGLIDLKWLEQQLQENVSSVALVCVMAANNETGVMQPWQQIQKITSQLGLNYFCDTTQLIGRVPFNFAESQLDFAVVSGHKLGALPGSGLLLVKKSQHFKPLIYGGGQENQARGGTQNYLGAETIAIASQTWAVKFQQLADFQAAQKKFEQRLKQDCPQIIIIGETQERLPGVSLIGYPGLHGQAVQIELESRNIFVTTSSACSDNEPATSKVLRAMKIEDRLGRSVVRVSFSLSQGLSAYPDLASVFVTIYQKLQKVSLT